MICVTRRDARGVIAQAGTVQGEPIVTVGTNTNTGSSYLHPQEAYEFAVYLKELAERVAGEHNIDLKEPTS